MPRSLKSAKILKVTVASKKHSHKPNKSQKPNKPQKGPTKARGNPKQKGFLSNVLDVGEGIAGVLPGVIRGVRSMFNLKQEASFSTPSSFATISNNATQLQPEMPVTHPSLGISGMRIYGCQPLCSANMSVSPDPFGPFDSIIVPAAVTDPNTVLLNPILLEGPLSVYGYLYDRYVFRGLRVKFTTMQTTTFLGVIALAIEKDPGNIVGTSFNAVRSVTPNVTFPIRVPKAELDWEYDGPDLFYCNQQGGLGPVSQARQDIQSVLKGFYGGNVGSSEVTPVGFWEIEFIIDFFDPVPPVALIGTTSAERHALSFIRQQMARKREQEQKTVRAITLPDGRTALNQFILEDVPSEGLTETVYVDNCVPCSGQPAAAASICSCRRDILPTARRE
jgi:hypothetical protein